MTFVEQKIFFLFIFFRGHDGSYIKNGHENSRTEVGYIYILYKHATEQMNPKIKNVSSVENRVEDVLFTDEKDQATW